jgi:hypothetical protein
MNTHVRKVEKTTLKELGRLTDSKIARINTRLYHKSLKYFDGFKAMESSIKSYIPDRRTEVCPLEPPGGPLPFSWSFVMG